MSGHIPGPWRVQGGAGVYRHDIVGPGNEDIAYVNESDGADEPTMYPVQANERLIAAAPDLLDALKAIVVLDDAIDLLAGNKTIAACVRAAIAKAEGA